MVGNSLGGYNSLATAAKYPELVRGVVLLNGAGRFEEAKVAIERATETALGADKEGTKKALREVMPRCLQGCLSS
jgi:pimeloyl-ACP methyl ester carboxylesterase